MFKLHHVCLYLVSIHQMAPTLTCYGVHLIAAFDSSIDPESHCIVKILYKDDTEMKWLAVKQKGAC